MTIIYLLLFISVVVALVFFAAFIFSIKKGQYEDTYTPSVRMLFDDELVKDETTAEQASVETSISKSNQTSN